MIEHIAIIALLNLLFFAKTLTYKYSSDDIPAAQRGYNYNKLKHWFYTIEGTERHSPQVDHFITTIIHTLTCVLIYTGFGSTDVSFMAALLFSFNPANNQGSVWISGRSYALPTTFMLAAMTFPAIAWAFMMMAGFYVLGFVSPIAFLGTEYQWFLLFMPLVFLLHGGRFFKNVGAKAKMEMHDEDKKFKWGKLSMAIKTFGFYTALAIFPFKNTFYHSFLQSAAGSGMQKAYTVRDRFFWIGLASGLGILFYWISTPWNTISCGLFWWCVCIGPFLNIFRTHQEIGERYMYMPLVGLMLATAQVLVGHPIVFAMFVTMYATKLWFYMDAYQDDFYLVEHSCMNSPNSWFAWHVRGMKRWDARNYREALTMWMMALGISPNEFKINYNLACGFMVVNQQQEAMKYLKVAEDNIVKGRQAAESRQHCENLKKGKIMILL